MLRWGLRTGLRVLVTRADGPHVCVRRSARGELFLFHDRMSWITGSSVMGAALIPVTCIIEIAVVAAEMEAVVIL